MRHLPLLLVLASLGCRSDDKPTTDTTPVDTAPLDEDGDGYDTTVDCDDATSVINPGAEEICDGFDNDCDGEVDEGATSTFYADADEDGFGDPSAPTEACSEPTGYVGIGNDCDDTDPESYPAAAERCDGADNDCDGEIDEDVVSEWHADADADGYGDPDSIIEDCDPPDGYSADATDCDDLDATAYPGAEEVCDGADNDCDKSIDEDVTSTYYQDADGDGFGLSDVTTEDCDLPTGYSPTAGDCDDADGTVSPNATELCDSVDNDCDGTTDEDDAADAATWYADDDGDSYGDASDTTVSCSQPTGYVGNDRDCDDASGANNPGAAEVCDSADNDCDGSVDEDDATDASTWYADSDGDGYGSSASTVACDQPSGFADNSDDCNDSEATANPGESEVCDEIDNDCDGATDEGVETTYYLDYDGDGYGDSDRSTEACSAPSSYVSDDSDCDDTDSENNPAASEVCDEVDNNCDGTTDEGVTSTYYADTDGDGFGDPDSTTAACGEGDGFVDDDADCDDGDEDINPDATELCDDVDQDCDGDTSSSDCEDCEAILNAGFDSGDGVYSIDLDGEGGDDPFDVYCDMTTDGGGWTMWWWHDSGASMSGVTDVLDGEVWDCDPSTDTSCYAKLPVGDPDELLVMNQTGNWAVWEFDGSTTSDNALDAFAYQTTVTQCSNAWTPVVQDGTMTDDPYVCDENNNYDPGCDCFWYRSQGSVYSFYLDDDTGWAETAFAGGKDSSNSLGVDSLETSYRYNSTSYELWLYWR